MVVFVGRYHKGFHASNDIKIIHRCVPREVGELVVLFLWLVVPFMEQVDAYTTSAGHRVKVNGHLCPDPRFGGEDG